MMKDRRCYNDAITSRVYSDAMVTSHEVIFNFIANTAKKKNMLVLSEK